MSGLPGMYRKTSAFDLEMEIARQREEEEKQKNQGKAISRAAMSDPSWRGRSTGADRH